MSRMEFSWNRQRWPAGVRSDRPTLLQNTTQLSISRPQMSIGRPVQALRCSVPDNRDGLLVAVFDRREPHRNDPLVFREAILTQAVMPPSTAITWPVM